jgi:hypothetical protein
MIQKLLILLVLFTLTCNAKEEPADKNEAPITQPATVDEPQPVSTPINKELQNGDIIFHTSTSTQSLAIQIASDSKYSHVGLVYKNGNNYQVFEAVQPVKLTPLQEFINRGENKHYVVKRLKNSETVLTPEGIAKMKELGEKYNNKNYDYRFEWSNDKIYCSELVWKIYEEAFGVKLGELEKIKDFDLTDPVVAAKAKERYGNNIPMEELIITPDRIFQSDKLVTVIEK